MSEITIPIPVDQLRITQAASITDDTPGIDAGNAVKSLESQATRLLLYLSDGSSDEKLAAYGHYLCESMGGQLTCLHADPNKKSGPFRKSAGQSHLVILGEPEQTFWRRLVAGPASRRAIAPAPTTILIAKQPRWPIRQILLAIRTEVTDEPAVDWAGYLGCCCDAGVTVLPLVPNPPLLFSGIETLQGGLGSLLASETPTGCQLRRLLKQLLQWQVKSTTVRMRQGEPQWQLGWEAVEGNYDLVVIGAEPGGRWRSTLCGDLVGALLSKVDRPVLIAKKRPNSVGARASLNRNGQNNR